MVAPRKDPEVRESIVSEADAGLRVEQLVTRTLGVTRNEAKELCAAGSVLLDGSRVSKGVRATAGAVLRLELAGFVRALEPEPDAFLDVRLERDDFVVVSKPAGIPTVPLSAGERGTLAGALLARYPEMQGVGYSAREPGVIHRLDNQTSGLVLAARSERAFTELVAALRGGLIEKRYLAVVEQAGLPDSGVIDRPLAPDSRRTGRVSVAEPTARYSRASTTQYRVLQRGPRFALVELDASLAFRHQVRVHLASLGHPIVGDALYSGPESSVLGARHALHASFLGWPGASQGGFAVEDAAPNAFLALLRL